MNELRLQQKVDEVNALAAKISDSASVVVVDYLGLNVDQVTRLRRSLYEAGCEMKVIKNNITRRAAEQAGYGEMVSSLTGPNAIAFSSDDAVAAAKVLYDFSQENKQLELKVGVIDGNYVNTDELMVYAQLPSRETLLTQVAAGLYGQVRNLAVALHLYTEEGVEAAE